MASDESERDLEPIISGRNSSPQAESDKTIDDFDSSYATITRRLIKPTNPHLSLSPVKSDKGANNNFEQVSTSEAVNASNSQLESTTSLKKPDDACISLSPVKSDESPNDRFEYVLLSDVIDASEIKDVIIALRDKHYDITKNVDFVVEAKCNFYFSKDYFCEVVNHRASCSSYPFGLIVPVAIKKHGVQKERSTKIFDSKTYSQRITKMAHARIGDRFPAPVILFDNKFICRAGTLTCRKSAIYNQAKKLLTPDFRSFQSFFRSTYQTGRRVFECGKTIVDLKYMKKLFRDDESVLRCLKVKSVIDLMIEYRKYLKDLVNVSSCESNHTDIYGSMQLQDLPYPGCEFFKPYNEANRNPERSKFEWSVPEVKRNLNIIEGLEKLIPDIDQTKLKEWDLVQLTQNYMKILLSILIKDNDGILIHCVCGWDRTPLFISLLRLSLWADGVIHPSLNHEEMAYLTVAYDWYLFGHPFRDRWKQKGEMMHFCFNFLPYIATDEFSVTKMFERLPAEERKNRKFPHYKPGREAALNILSQHVINAYNVHVIQYYETKLV